VGAHPESGLPITANFGRYGPYIVPEGTYANLPSPDEVFTIGINRAVDLLAEKKSRAPRGSTSALKDLGVHPEGGRVRVLSGRYGPYVKWQKVNATLPNGKDPENITLEEAVTLLAAKTAKTGSRKTVRKKKKKKAGQSIVENPSEA
jgi:DNA topoisomerase-1